MNKDTLRYISIAERPGGFGVEFHNRGYELFGMNRVYIPLRVRPNELEAVIRLVKDNFQGCSVSMPHKINVREFLDSFDNSAINCEAVNTIIKQKNGKLKGYNTDYNGARRAIEERINIEDKKVLMLGAGGVARAIGKAVVDLGGRLTISNRTKEKSTELAKKLGTSLVEYKELEKVDGCLLINATSIGMNNIKEIPFSVGLLEKFEAVMDVVVRETKLISKAKELEKIVIPSRLMTVYQAAKQFELYTRKELPEEFLRGFL